MKTKQTNKELALTVKEIKQQGVEITSEMTILEMIKALSNSIMLSRDSGANNTILTHQVNQFLSLVYDQMDILYKDLDDVASRLLNNDDEKELEASK